MPNPRGRGTGDDVRAQDHVRSLPQGQGDPATLRPSTVNGREPTCPGDRIVGKPSRPVERRSIGVSQRDHDRINLLEGGNDAVREDLNPALGRREIRRYHEDPRPPHQSRPA